MSISARDWLDTEDKIMDKADTVFSIQSFLLNQASAGVLRVPPLQYSWAGSVMMGYSGDAYGGSHF